MTLTLTILFQSIIVLHSAFFALLAAAQRLYAFMLLLLVFASHMSLNIIFENSLLDDRWNITSAFVFLYGPSFYLFIREITWAEQRLELGDVIHYTPFLFVAFWRTEHIIIETLALFSITLYAIAIGRYVWRYNHVIKVNIADESGPRLTWLYGLLASLAALAIYDIIRTVSVQYLGRMTDDIYYLLTLISLFFVISVFILFTFQFKLRFKGLLESDVTAESNSIQDNSNQVQEASAEEEALAQRSLQLILNEGFFLKPDLRLSDVADRLDVDPRTLSQAISRATGKYFPKHVTTYRIAYSQSLIRNAIEKGRPINFLKISFDAGFQTKSNFNLAFKQETGLTPSQYRNSCQESVPSMG